MFIRYLLLAFTISGAPLIQQPNNIICFPERDFCNFENFLDNTGKSLLVEVNRQGKVIGSAVGVVSGDIVAFEVNHPGWSRWTLLAVGFRPHATNCWVYDNGFVYNFAGIIKFNRNFIYNVAIILYKIY